MTADATQLAVASDDAGPPSGRDKPRPRLTGTVWLVIASDAASAVGSGMTMPFLIVYLHAARGMSLSVAGLVAASVALASLAGNPIGGALADRRGARDALVTGLLLAGAGTAAMPLVRTPAQAFAAALVVGLGVSIAWPAQDTLLATLVPPDRRQAVFAVRYATMNAGLGAGALLAAVLLEPTSPASFTVVYALDAGTYVAVVPALLLGLPRARPVRTPVTAERSRQGYRAVVADAAFRRVWLLTSALVTISYGQYHAAFPAYATEVGGIGTSTLGLAFAANTLAVVAFAPLAARILPGRPSLTAIRAAASGFAVTWLIAAAAVQASSTTAVATGLIAALVVFAVAESALAPTLPTLANDLADASGDVMRGRYNGAATLAWTTGFLLGPAVGGLALGAGAGHAYVLVLAAASACLIPAVRPR